jgi:hypothetical protein
VSAARYRKSAFFSVCVKYRSSNYPSAAGLSLRLLKPVQFFLPFIIAAQNELKDL